LVADNQAALMPRWIITGVIMSFLQVGIYDNIRSAFDGSGWLKGMKFGVIAFLFYMAFSAGWSGIFNLPEAIWMWWNIEALLVFLVGSAVMGFVVDKLSSD
jgi:hypothetical protein